MIKALTELNGLLGRYSAVYSGLNLRQRSFAALVYKLCNVKMLSGMREDVFSNGTSRLAEYVGVHIIQFYVEHCEAILGTVFLDSVHIRQLHAVTNQVVKVRIAGGEIKDGLIMSHMNRSQIHFASSGQSCCPSAVWCT